MPNPIPPRKVLHHVTPGKTPPLPKLNGKDVGLDPRIAGMVTFLDQAIRTRNETIGTVVAAVGVLLGSKVGNPDNLERFIYDVTTAVRVGFYLRKNKGK